MALTLVAPLSAARPIHHKLVVNLRDPRRVDELLESAEIDDPQSHQLAKSRWIGYFKGDRPVRHIGIEYETFEATRSDVPRMCLLAQAKVADLWEAVILAGYCPDSFRALLISGPITVFDHKENDLRFSLVEGKIFLSCVPPSKDVRMLMTRFM